MKLRPTLIIGVGTSGLKVVENVQKHMYENLGVNSLPIYKYLYIETDMGYDIEETPLGSDIVPVRPYVKSVRTSIEILKGKGFELDWVPENLDAQLASISAGAGGVRPGGRLCLMDYENFPQIYSHIKNAYNEITLPASVGKIDSNILRKAKGEIDHTPVIYVVGTLVGGTNSGMFIDLGYIVREISGMREGGALYGVFLVPPEGENLPAGYANTYGALQELEFFRNEESTYNQRWPVGSSISNKLPPYAIVYLLSQDYRDPKYGRIRDLRGMYKVVGFQLFCNLIGMSSLRASVLVDGMNAGFGFYSTYGISSITYPKYSISEYVACLYGEELCDRWLDVHNYFDPGNEKQVINEANIRLEAKKFFDEILLDSFGNLEARSEGVSLVDDIYNDTEKLLKKHIDNPIQYLQRQFTSSGTEGYYAVITNNLNSSRDYLIQKIKGKIEEVLNRTQNLKYTESYLEAIKESIDKTSSFWKSLDISENNSQWSALVTQELRQLQVNTHNFILEKPNVLIGRLTNLLEKLKIHLMINVQNQLKENISSGMMVSTRDPDVKLPTLKILKDLRASVDEVKNRLEKRKDEIAEEITDETVPIYRIWHDGNFENDYSVLLGQFKQLKKPIPHSKDVTSESAWQFLSKNSKPIFESIKKAYQREVIGLCPTVNVTGKAVENISLSRIYAERTISSLLRLDKGGESGPGVPRFVIGNSLENIKTFIKALNDDGFGEYRDDHARVIEFLENTIVFYEEKSKVNPHSDLIIKDVIKYFYENPPTDKVGKKTVEKNVWLSFRRAFNLKKLENERERDKRLDVVKDLINIIRDFVLEWKKMPNGKWQPSGLRYLEGFDNISTSDPPLCQIRLAGKVDRDWKLIPDDKGVLENLAQAEAYFDALKHQLVEGIKKKGLEKLVDLFNKEIKSRMEEQWGVDETNRKAEYYFGIADNGLIHRIIKSEF